MADTAAPEALRELWLYTNTDCNLTCRHCLLTEHGTRPDLDDLIDCASQALELGARTIFLTGGEPFVRGDLGRLLREVAPRARTVILTNGTLVTARRLAELDRLGAADWKHNLSFQVSLDGDEASHEALRGKGTYRPALEGVRSLIEWGRSPTVSTAVTRLNLDRVHEVTRLAGDLGLRAHHLFFPHQTGRLAGGSALVPSPVELLQVVRRCRSEARAAGVILDNDTALASRVGRPEVSFDGCNGGREMVAVGADGVVYPCPSMVGHRAVGDTESLSLSEAWRGARLGRFRSHSLEQRSECRCCEVKDACGGGCAAHAYWAGGSFQAREPYCELYRGIIEDHLRVLEQSDGRCAGRSGGRRGCGAPVGSPPARYSCT